MKTKILAIMAVLALAFAGVAVITAEQSDAASTATAISVDKATVVTQKAATWTITVNVTITDASNGTFAIASSVDDVIADVSEVAYTVTDGTAIVAQEITVLKAGVTTLEFSANGQTATTTVFAYDADDDAKIIGYGAVSNADTYGAIKSIIYSDGTALFDFSGFNYLGTKVVAVPEYNDVDSAGILVTVKDRILIDIKGQLDVLNVANTDIEVSGYDVTFATVSIEPAAYALTLVGNTGVFDDDATTYALTATDLKRGNVTKTSDDPADAGIADPEKIGWTLLGYALAADATAAIAVPMQTDKNTIEDFVFAVGTGDNNHKVYAVWSNNMQIYLSAVNTADGEKVQQHLDTASFDAYAPKTFETGDVAILRIVQDGTASATAGYNVVAYTLSSWKTAPAVDPNCAVKMLANGVYVISGITESVVLSITAGTPSDSYQLSVKSVDNAVSTYVPTGTAVVDFTAFDIVPAGTIDIQGTYVKYIAGQYVYGAIGGAAAPITLTATEDQKTVEDATITGTVLTLSADHQTYKLTYAGASGVGFYAIKAVYTNGGAGYSTEYTLGSF